VKELPSLFQKCGLEAREEQIYPLLNPATRDDLNLAVTDGIEHILTAALNMGKKDLVESSEQIASHKDAALKDLEDLNCWYCYDVHVVTGKRA
jgi:hypothetical protein